VCDPSEWCTMLTWSWSHTLHPYMLYFYTESKQKHVFHTYAMLLHWELAQTFLSTSPQNKDSMYSRSLSILHRSLKKRHELYVVKKERKLKKESWKKMIKRRAEWKSFKQKKERERMSIKDSPWSQSSRFGERIFKELTFHSYPHICTLDHVWMLFSSMDPCFDFTI
jgi:hypothetical protein